MKRHLGFCLALLGFILPAQSNELLGSSLINLSDSRPHTISTTSDDSVLPLVANVPQRGSISAPAVGACSLSPLQYSFFVPGEAPCHLPFIGAGVTVTADQNLKMYIRHGQRVEVDGDRIVADYAAESTSHDQGVDIFVSSTPPLQGGTYFIAITNCGSATANCEISAGFFGLDVGGPVIFRAEVVDKTLLVYGIFFQSGAELLLNGKKQKQVRHDEQEPGCILIADKTGKKIAPGERVTLRVRFPNGVATPRFRFRRPRQ